MLRLLDVIRFLGWSYSTLIQSNKTIYCVSFHLSDINYVSFYLNDFEWETDIKENFPKDAWMALNVSWHFYDELGHYGVSDQLLLPTFLASDSRVRGGSFVKLMKL